MFGIGASNDLTHNIWKKLATEDIWFLRYCRSRFFTFVFFMQKLTGISSGQNNESCGIFHHESNKIGFTFFWFFCDFLRNLQETATALILFQIRLCSKAPRNFRFLRKYPCFCGKTLSIKKNVAMWPPAAGRRGSGRNPTTGGAGVWGKRWGEIQDSPRDWFACSEG
jgi:hypothetical protein